MIAIRPSMRLIKASRTWCIKISYTAAMRHIQGSKFAVSVDTLAFYSSVIHFGLIILTPTSQNPPRLYLEADQSSSYSLINIFVIWQFLAKSALIAQG